MFNGSIDELTIYNRALDVTEAQAIFAAGSAGKGNDLGNRSVGVQISATVGANDDPSVFEPKHHVLRDPWRRMRGLRLGRTGAVVQALVPSILEQKVTGREAFRSYWALVRKYGEPAPGPADLLLPPAPRVLAELPYWAFHPLGIERRRADTVRRACARA